MYLQFLYIKNSTLLKSLFTYFIVFSLLVIVSCKIDRNTKYDDTELGLDKLTEIPTKTNEATIRGDWQKPDLVVSKLGNLENKTVVDIGAGSGYFMTYLMQKAARVIAVDIDESAIEILNIVKSAYPEEVQSRIDIRLVEPDNPGLKENEVDAALLVNTVAYLNDRISYFSGLKNSIKDGGIFMIVDYKMKKLAIDAPPPSERLTMLQVEEDLEQAGFKIKSTDDRSLDYQYIIIAEKAKG